MPHVGNNWVIPIVLHRSHKWWRIWRINDNNWNRTLESIHRVGFLRILKDPNNPLNPNSIYNSYNRILESILRMGLLRILTIPCIPTAYIRVTIKSLNLYSELDGSLSILTIPWIPTTFIRVTIESSNLYSEWDCNGFLRIQRIHWILKNTLMHPLNILGPRILLNAITMDMNPTDTNIQGMHESCA